MAVLYSFWIEKTEYDLLFPVKDQNVPGSVLDNYTSFLYDSETGVKVGVLDVIMAEYKF